ncbi:MAG: alanine racemase [Ignavibacteria bacterium GWF2_33_9]|nr:MAG: alanine racemase [Ignavibacteria bacterium GWF2_33_9]
MRNSFIEINLNNLEHNLEQIAKHIAPAKMLPIIKANAYGHGMIGIAKNLVHPSIEMLGIAYPNEGIELREAGETRKLLIIIPPEIDEIADIIDNQIDITIGNLSCLPEINAIAKKKHRKIKAHLYINTGMNRDGITSEEFNDFLKTYRNYDYIIWEGICSHLAASDFDDKSFSYEQIDKFKKVLELSEIAGLQFKYVHIANSGAAASIGSAHFNLVRPGIALHGLMPRSDYAEKLNLKPTLSLKTYIKKINHLKKNETAGYSFRFVSKEETNIAVIPLGYGDGFLFSLNNNAQCLIHGKRYDIVGSICMDQMFVDIKQDNINEGEQVVLIGKQGNEEITVYELAKRAKTIPYEITTSILKRLPRIFVENNV